jgi:glycosyltransferase involved in cell wall biosynthesis
MSLVTITDHNSIDGCMEIAHLPGVFISEEVTAYFPEDQCKVHVLVYDIDEAKHKDIQKARESIFDLVEYLDRENIHHALAHPLFGVNDRLTLDHFEKLLLLFKNFELNGARDIHQNRSLRLILSQLGKDDIQRLAAKHNIEPCFPEPWYKNLTGGSDDHSSITIAGTHTQADGTLNHREFLDRMEQGKTRVMGRGSTPLALAHNLYGIAYQFYKTKLALERYVSKDLFLKFMDRSLQANVEDEARLFSRIHFLWSQRKHPKLSAKLPGNVQQVLRREAQDLIRQDPLLMQIAEGRHLDMKGIDARWFRFVNQLSGKVLLHFGNHLLDHLSGAHVFNIFHSIGSAGGLYTLLAPYFVSFSVFSGQRKFTREIQREFLLKNGSAPTPEPVSVAHFTDTFYEVNGVASTLRQQVKIAAKTNKDLTVITCDAGEHGNAKGIRNFQPIGVYELPEYPEQKLFYPPFLEMLNYCYEQDFSHIHSATPGPIGISALAIARIMKLPIYGTYHTALPQYAQYLTNDWAIEELMWRYILWYYDQMDLVFVPSRSTADELREKGIAPEKIRLFPRGIDVERFHPSKRGPRLDDLHGTRDGLKLLYVGRVSKEKDLPVLQEAFRLLTESIGEPVHLIVVGDGPYLEEMKRSMRGSSCIFTGYLDGEELAEVYASCDIFVFPSTTDTFGNVVLEAQASGLPVVVTDCGGPRENMIPGKTGLVAAAGDPHSLFHAVRALAMDRTRAKQMGKAARAYMKDRSFESAFDETWKMYQKASDTLVPPLAKAV